MFLLIIRAAPFMWVPEGTPKEAPKKRRVAVFVEPSPFSHMSGMKNRFLRLIEVRGGAG